MRWTDEMLREEIFTHILKQGDPLDGVRHFNTTRIILDLVAGRQKFPINVVKLGINQELHDLLVKVGGVELDHLARITPDRLEDPVLVLNWPQGEHQTIIDGSHRLVARFRRGLDFAMALFIEFEDIREYMVTDIPPQFEQLMIGSTEASASARA